jgi:hypothetical protein
VAIGIDEISWGGELVRRETPHDQGCSPEKNQSLLLVT